MSEIDKAALVASLPKLSTPGAEDVDDAEGFDISTVSYDGAPKPLFEDEDSGFEGSLEDELPTPDDTEEAEEEDVESKEPEESSEEESDEEEESVKEEEKEAPKGKTVKAEVDGKEIDIPAEALFEVVIDGQKEKVPLQELKNNYSGQTAIARAYTKLDKDTKQADSVIREKWQEVESVREHLQLLPTLSPQDLIRHLGVIQGKDPDEVMAQMVESTIKLVQEYQALTPAERVLRTKLHKYEYEQNVAQNLAKLRESKQKEQEAVTQQEERKQKVFSAMEKMDITFDEFKQGINDFAKRVDDGEISGENVDEFDILIDIHKKKTFNVVKDRVTMKISQPSQEYLKRICVAIEAEQKYHGRLLKSDEVTKIVDMVIADDIKKVKETPSKKPVVLGKSEKASSKPKEGALLALRQLGLVSE